MSFSLVTKIYSQGQKLSNSGKFVKKFNNDETAKISVINSIKTAEIISSKFIKFDHLDEMIFFSRLRWFFTSSNKS